MPSFNVYADQNPSNLDVLNSQKFNYGTTPKDPVAEQNQTFIAYWNGVGGTGPEYIDGTGYFIKYLIDTEGNVVNPEPTDDIDNPQSVALYNLINNFEPGKRAVVKLIEPNPTLDTVPNSEILQGIHTIAHTGRIVPILVTETGINNDNYIRTMSFGPLISETTDPVGNVSARMFYINQNPGYFFVNDSAWTDFPFNGHTNLGAGAWTRSGNTLTAQSSSAEAGTRIRFRVRFYINSLDMANQSTPFGFRVLKNGSTVVWEKLNHLIGNQYNQYVNFDPSGYLDFEAGDTFKLQFYNANGTPALGNGTYQNYQFKILGYDSDVGYVSDTSLTIEQENAPTLGGTAVELIDGVNAIYAFPSTSPSASYCAIFDRPNEKYSEVVFLSSSKFIWDSGLVQNLDPASSTFGFSPITIPFGDIKPGDFIRFEYNKDQTYTIVDITEDFVFLGVPIPDTLVLKVTPNIGSILGANTSLQRSGHFVIYRVINDGTYITLDVKKDAPGGAYTGILQPEFVSQELIDKYDKIITDLTSKEIIN